ncbi:MAG: HTH domain-containing protein [Ginsengibacter sp.]
MTFNEYTEKLETIKYLSQHKRTGSVEKLAEKLNVSQRTIRRMMQHLRERGFPVRFNRNRCTYEVINNVSEIKL